MYSVYLLCFALIKKMSTVTFDQHPHMYAQTQRISCMRDAYGALYEDL